MIKKKYVQIRYNLHKHNFAIQMYKIYKKKYI